MSAMTDGATGPVDVEDVEALKEKMPELSSDDRIKQIQTEWQRYYAELGNDKQKTLTTLAPRDEYKITFIDGQTKNYKRKRISTKDFMDIEMIRAKFRKEKDPEKSTELLMDLYFRLSSLYLIDSDTGKGMTKQEYERCEWEDTRDFFGIKTICDACNHRAVYGLANFR